MRKLLTYSLKYPFNFREDICVKQTEDTFAPAVTSLYINAKGIDKSEKAQEQVYYFIFKFSTKFKPKINK